MRLKHKKKAILLILLVIPIATIISVNANESEEIDFIYYISNPFAQAQIDELVSTAESLGLVVNAIQYINPYALIARMYTGDYDLAFGPLLSSRKDFIILA